MLESLISHWRGLDQVRTGYYCYTIKSDLKKIKLKNTGIKKSAKKIREMVRDPGLEHQRYENERSLATIA